MLKVHQLALGERRKMINTSKIKIPVTAYLHTCNISNTNNVERALEILAQVDSGPCVELTPWGEYLDKNHILPAFCSGDIIEGDSGRLYMCCSIDWAEVIHGVDGYFYVNSDTELLL